MSVIAFVHRKANALIEVRAEVHGQELLIEMYGPIGASIWDDTGVTASQVSEALRGEYDSVTVRINSPGGSAFEGIAIYNLLKDAGKPVTVIVDGLAASAASIIAMAAGNVQMKQGSMMMIHPAQMIARGDSKEMKKAAELLEKATANMAGIYSARTGQPTETVMEMLYAETWMDGIDAIKYGFADSTSDEAGSAEAVAAGYDLAAFFTKTPEKLQLFKADDSQETPLSAVVAGMPAWEALRRLELMTA